MRAFSLVVLGFVAVAVLAKEENNRAHGFGDDIEWHSLDEALELSKEQNKPVFLLIHKTWCGACKALRKNIQQSNKRSEFVELSKKFVMVNLEDDEEPEDEKYAPDGAYIPRLLFLDQNTDLLAVDNKKNFPNNAYYFPQAVDVIKAMKRALKEHGTEVEEKPAESKKSTTKLDKEEAVAESKDKKTEEKKEKAEKKEKSEKKTEKKEKSDKKVDDKKEKKEKSDKKEKAEKKEKSEKKEEKPAKKDKKAEKKEEKLEKKTEKKEKSDKKKDDKKKKTEL